MTGPSPGPAGRWGHRLTSLDGLRGLFAVAVTVFHVEIWLTAGHRFRGGWVGVDGFFVLSGFLIVSLLVDEQRRFGTIAYFRFLGRRLLRLLPALLVLLAFTSVLLRTTDRLRTTDPVSWQELGKISAAAAAFSLNWLQTLRGHVSIWFVHLWSLAPEFQFYVVVPLLIMGLHRLGAPRWAWVALFGGLAAGSALLRGYVWMWSPDTQAAYIDTHLRADSFLIGSVAALMLTWGWIDQRSRWTLRISGVSGLVFLAWVMLTQGYLSPWMYEEGGLTLCALAVAAVIALLVLEPLGLIARGFSLAPIVAVGRRSYSLYLWHMAAILWVKRMLSSWSPSGQVAAAIALTAVVTELSYRFVELPGIKLGRRLSARSRAPRHAVRPTVELASTPLVHKR